MSALDDQPFPRAALAAAALFVAASLGVVGAARLGAFGAASPPSAVERRLEAASVPVAGRDLRFIDRPEGGVRIEDDAGRAIDLAPGQDGFIRGVARGFARDRRARGLGADAPFRLQSWTDGGLTLTDLATGRSVNLLGFGLTNRDAFARLLALPAEAGAAQADDSRRGGRS